MWLFTRYGFYSVVCAVAPDGSIDRETVHVRARCVDHLRRLKQRFESLAGCEIIDSPEGDYPVRIVLPKSAWSLISFELANEIEWANFRNEATARHNQDRHYLDAIHDVWDRMAHF